MKAKVKRRYQSRRRREQAGETRERIVRAAHDLFVSPGYGRTTIADIANTAGVAVETIYGAYRNKPTLLRQVWYATFRGDDEDIRLLDRPEIHAVLAERNLATRLRAHAVAITTCVPSHHAFVSRATGSCDERTRRCGDACRVRREAT